MKILVKAIKKITRDAFLYMEPKQKKNAKEFAQCSTCVMWTGPKARTCTIHGKNVMVRAGDSCSLYVEGDPMPEEAGNEMALVKPSESALLRNTKVRCENCKYGDGKRKVCTLFEKMNKSHNFFDLREKIDPKGCCNAWVRK